MENISPKLLSSSSQISPIRHHHHHHHDNEQQQKRKEVQYEHTLPSRFPRWTARESFEWMAERPWHHVNHFYSHIILLNNASVSSSFHSLFSTPQKSQFPTTYTTLHNRHLPNNDNGDETLLDDSFQYGSITLPSQYRQGRWARANFKILLSYHGPSFDGWQKQPALYTVQGLVESSLGSFVDERKAQLLKDKCKPLEASVVVAGRTDKGVSALHQVCSFYTWRKDVRPRDVEDAINNAAPGKLRVVSVSEVSREFHPNFSAKWRRYLYIFPLKDGENMAQHNWGELGTGYFSSGENCGELKTGSGEDTDEDDVGNLSVNDQDMFEGAKKPRRFSVTRVDQLLRQLEGKLLSYKVFARDTKASRNIGPPTECFLYHARAAEARLPNSVYSEGIKVMAVELVGNRFLRKMVRVLVATSMREAAAGAEEDALIKLMDATCRRATAPPAPPDGLCLVDVGYTSFNPKDCLIH